MAQGMLYTFNDTVSVWRSVSGLIYNTDPMEIKMQMYLGLNNQDRFQLLNFPNHKYEWMGDTFRDRTTAIDEVGVVAGTTDFDVDDASLLKPGDVIQVEDELIWVGAVNTTTNNISSLSRGWAGTTAAAHADNTVVTYKYSARLEGDDSDDYPYTTPTNNYNFSQIFHGEIEISGSEQDATTRIGMSDKYMYELQKLVGGLGGGNGQPGRAGDLAKDLENTFFGDQSRVQRASGTAGAMGGPKYFCTTTNGYATDYGAALLTEDGLLDAMQTAWSGGGTISTIVCNIFNKRLINDWYKEHISTERSERTGGVRIDRIENDFGEQDIILHRDCPADEVYLLDRNTMGFVTLRDWRVEPLGKTGDGKKDQVIGEYGFVVTSPKCNHIIKNTATS